MDRCPLAQRYASTPEIGSSPYRIRDRFGVSLSSVWRMDARLAVTAVTGKVDQNDGFGEEARSVLAVPSGLVVPRLKRVASYIFHRAKAGVPTGIQKKR